MEPFLDNTDKEKEVHAHRSARIVQMKREKQLQEQRRRMIKKYMPYAGGALAVVIMLICAIVILAGKSKESDKQQIRIETSETLAEKIGDTTEQQAAAEENINSQKPENVVEDSVLQESEATKNPENMDKTEPSADVDTQSKETVAQAAVSMIKDSYTPQYTFEETSDTVTIYSNEVISTNAILINESTDTIVASKGANQRINPASMTKVLTVLVAAEHITAEELDNTFTMTTEITDYAYVNDCSSVGFLSGEKVTIRDLFYGTTLHSGGDAAVGLATYVAGSHEAFVDMMNEKLEALGIADSTHYTNCVGLYDTNHYSTVYDMAIIMKAAMQNELCRDFLSLHTYTTTTTQEHPEGIEISNWFLRKIEDKDTGGEVLCAKTGYVVESKNCAVSYQKNAAGDSYICVTTGSTSSWRCIYDHVEIYNQYVS